MCQSLYKHYIVDIAKQGLQTEMSATAMLVTALST